MTIYSINPATGESLATFEPLTIDETKDAVATAHRAFAEWRQTSFDQRKEVLLSVAAQLRERKEEYAKLITQEMGKRLKEAESEIEFCAQISEYYANGAESFLADQPLDLEDAEAYVQHMPIGALLGVMPWNFPFYQVIRFAAPNLMAGNTVLVKHAGIVPQCAQAIAELFADCGTPDGVYANLFIPVEFVETIIGDERIQGVSLTGSEKAGAAVAAQAGKNIKRSVLELGGNDAFIVLDDADLDHAVKMAVRGRMVNNGQSCVAAKRFIVLDSVAETFTEGLKAAMGEMTVGDPMDRDTRVGPMSSEAAAEDLAQKVQRSVDAGATVVLGADRPSRDGAYYNPTILADVAEDMPTFDQELFGPVATIYTVQDEDAAIELANNSSYGLGGSIYSSDVGRARRLAERIDTGMVFINQPTNSQAELPFGGTKNSGYGRELSHYGILEFVNKKLIHSKTGFGS